jgi:serine/threonine protein kinase
MTAIPAGYSRGVHIGAGAFGEVFRAREDAAGRWVALKRLRLSDQARSEATALAAGLPCLPALYALFSARGSDWISMEYMHGLPLRELSNLELGEDDAIHVAAQLVRAMASLHASGISHGDLKPENILLEPDGRIRLLDLGFSANGTAVATGASTGYAAPEAGSKGIDPRRSDLWSLGLTLHEILAGARPGPRERAAGWPRLRSVALGWIPLVDSLLMEDPARRPPSAESLLRDLPPVGWSVGLAQRVEGEADRRLAGMLAAEAQRLVLRGRSHEALPLLQESLDLDPDQKLSLDLLPRLRLDSGRSRRWALAVAVAVAVITAAVAAISIHASSEDAYVPIKTDSGLDRIRTRGPAGGEQEMPLRERVSK